MKKFTSILFALALVLSVNAAPVKFAKVAPVKNAKLELAKQLRRAPKAKQAATNVAVSKITSNYYEQSGDVYYMLYDETKENVFTFDILCATGMEDVELGKTYTIAEMDSDYCSWGDPTSVYYGYGTYYKTASFKKTVDEKGKIKIDATVVDVDDEEFVLSFDESLFPELPAGGTYVVDDFSYEFYEGDEGDPNDVYFTFEVASIGATFYFDVYIAAGTKDLKSDSVYTIESIESEYSYIQTAAKVIEYKSVSFKKSVAADGSYTITIVAVDANGNTWNLSASKAAPTVISQTLTLNGIAEAGSSYSQIEAANADSSIIVSLLLYSDALVGSFTEEDLVTFYSLSYVLYGGVEYDIESAAFTVTYDENAGKYIANGTLNCVDPNDETNQAVFTIALTLAGEAPVAPAQGGTTYVSLAMQDMTVAQKESYWELTGSDPTNTYYLAIRSKTADVDGTYTEANLDDYWTYIGMTGSVFYDLYTASVTVALANGLLTVKGTMTFINASANDTIVATVDVAGIADGKTHLDYDASSADFIVDFPNPEIITTYISQYGVIVVRATNDDNSTIYLEFNVAKTATDLAAGEYDINTSAAEGTVAAGAGVDSEGYINGSYAGYKGTNGLTTPLWWIVSGKVTVADNGIITVDAVNTYDKLIKCVLGTSSTTAIENTDAAVKASKRLIDGNLFIEKNGVRYNAIGVIVK